MTLLGTRASRDIAGPFAGIVPVTLGLVVHPGACERFGHAAPQPEGPPDRLESRERAGRVGCGGAVYRADGDEVVTVWPGTATPFSVRSVPDTVPTPGTVMLRVTVCPSAMVAVASPNAWTLVRMLYLDGEPGARQRC